MTTFENNKWHDPGSGFNFKADASDPAISIQVGSSAVVGQRKAAVMRKVCAGGRREAVRWCWQEVCQGVGRSDVEALRNLYKSLREMLAVVEDFGKRIKPLLEEK